MSTIISKIITTIGDFSITKYYVLPKKEKKEKQNKIW